MQNRCPRCAGPCIQQEEKLFFCPKCKMQTDCQDDGDIGYRSQERYAERKEEFQIRQRERERQNKTRQMDRLMGKFGDRRRGR